MLVYKKARLDYLNFYWKQEFEIYMEELKKTKSLPEDGHLLKQMGAFDNYRLVNKLLRHYLDRCLYVHSMAFF